MSQMLIDLVRAHFIMTVSNMLTTHAVPRIPFEMAYRTPVILFELSMLQVQAFALFVVVLCARFSKNMNSTVAPFLPKRLHWIIRVNKVEGEVVVPEEGGKHHFKMLINQWTAKKPSQVPIAPPGAP